MLKHENSSEPGPDGKPLIKDPSDLGSFDADAKSIRENAAKLFHSKTDEAEFMANYDLDTVVAKNRLQSIYMKKQIEMGQVTTMEDSDRLGNLYATTGDKQYLEQQEALWDAAVARDQFDPKEGYRNKTKAANKAKKDSFLYDLSNNFKVVEDNLKNNTYGLDVLQLKNARSLYNTEKGRIQNGHQTELDQLFYDNTLIDDVIDKYVADKWIEPKDGTSYKNSLQKGVAVESDPFMYNSMLERANEVKNFGGWWKTTAEKKEAFKQGTQMRIDILAKVGSGLSKKDAGEMLGVVDRAFERHTPYSKGLMQLTDFADKNYTARQKDIVKQNIYKRYMELAKEGVDPVDALKQAKDIYEKYNIDDLEFTAKETNLPIGRIVDLLEKQQKGKK